MPATRAECAAALLEGRSFGGYELIEEIARGGMGVVYKARQRGLNRIVALKMVLGGPLASASLHQRFLAEAQTAASLQHPNIVAIHEVGEHAGQSFFSMDYVEGRNLAELLRDGPLPPRQAATYAQTIAEAVHYAHSRGVLHRDLKPSNVLIDQSDQPRITDFGLAKRLTGESDLTVSGQVLGSPNFMAPEQAQGRSREVGPPSDVYSIGALLYHLLTGRPPFQAATLTEVLRLAVTTEPAAPGLLNPCIPRDLETICLKCLEKGIPRRYPTARTLADELGRFLRGEPILARPLGRAGKAAKWCRRNPRLASAVTVALLSLLVGLAGVAWEWRRAESQRARAEANEYVLSMNVAQQALKANNPGRALELLNRYRPAGKSEIRNPKSEIERRGFEWLYLWQQCRSEAETVIGKLRFGVRSLEVSPDGKWLFAGSQSGGGKVWNLQTGEPVPLVAERADWAFGAFSPDSRLLFIDDQTFDETNGIINTWDLRTLKRLAPITDPRPIGPIAFSPDGRWFGFAVLHAPTEPRLVLMDLQTRKRLESIAPSAGQDGIQGYDWVFTPDGRGVIASKNAPDPRILFWDLASGTKPHLFPGHQESITAMAISPDGQLLATGAGYTETDIKLWQVPSFRPLGQLSGHQGWITALKFSPDGQTLASAAADQTLRLWEVGTGKPRRVFAGLSENVWRLCFAENGSKLFSGSSDGTIHRWSADTRQAEGERGFRRRKAGAGARVVGPEGEGFWRPPAGADTLAVAPGGEQFAVIRQGGVYLGEARGNAAPGQLVDLGTNNTCLLFAPDGHYLSTGTQTGEVQVWSQERRHAIRRLPGAALPVAHLRQDQRGSLLLAFHREHDLELSPPRQAEMLLIFRTELWSTSEWQQRRSWTVSGPNHAVSPDGQWLVADAAPGALQLGSLTDPFRTNALLIAGKISDLAFSPNGRMLSAGTVVGTVKIWELPSRRELAEFRAHSRPLSALAFSPDNRRLATAADRGEEIKLWDISTWQELITLPHGSDTLQELLFCPEGNQLIAKSSQGDLLFWRVPSFEEIAQGERRKASR